MLIENLVLYEDKYCIRVNQESDSLFYYFDYDVRTSDINMQFQHFHPFYELFIVLSPDTKHFLEGQPYDLQMFDIMGLRPNVLHRTQYPACGPCKRLIIQFNLPHYGSGLSNEYEQLLSLFHQKVPIFRFDTELQHRIYRKLNDIYKLAQKTDSMRNMIIHQKFIEFLTLLYLNQDNNLYRSESDMTPAEQKIYAITSYIHGHYAEELSLNMLAQQFYISNYYLSHQFKDVTGFTLSDYIQMTRVRNVQSMLMSTQIPITEVALRCGFNSFSQFNRIFRKHIGMAPSAYRKKYQAAAI